MGDNASDDSGGAADTGDTDHTAKLALPTLSRPKLGRRKKRKQEAVEPEPRVVEPEPEPTHVAEAPPVVEPEPEPTHVAEAPRLADESSAPPLFADQVDETDDVQVAHDTPDPVHDEEDEPRRSRQFTAPTLPPLPGRLAAAVTGLIVGVFGAMLTYVGLKGCEVVKGTDSCGAPGLLLLIAILILMMLLGSVMLAAWHVSDPRSTSFLAVGVLCVIMLVTLMEALFSPWMFLLVPIVSAGGYVLSYWVTTALVEPPHDRRQPTHDIR